MESKQEKSLNKRNAELEKELAKKNRDLEIEGALEKVRSSALAMRVPADMLEVCHIICEQLEVLHIKEIRNVQTAVFNEAKKTYVNYEYYRLYDKSIITGVEYGHHPVQNEFAEKMLAGPGLFFTHVFEDEALREWVAYQKGSGQFADPHLDNVTAVNYYWFSLGPIAWGITFYAPVSEAELEIIKRFRNVFDLAYRRFADIQMAEAQAKEARLETALERVRAVAMAMKKPEELLDVCKITYSELSALGFTNIRNAQISIDKEGRDSHVVFNYSDRGTINMLEAPTSSHPLLGEISAEMKKSKDALFQKEISGKEFVEWRRWKQQIAPSDEPRLEEVTSVSFYFYSIGFGLIGISSYGPISEDQLSILKRFKKVFELGYTRYADVAQAGAQVREAQIEAAMERTRTQSMLMQHSTELDDTLRVFHQQVLLLGIRSAFSFLWLPDEEMDRHIFWAAWAENNSKDLNSKAIDYPLDRNEPATAQCLIDWKGKEQVVSYHVPPDGVENYFAAWQELIDGVEQLKPEFFQGGLYYVEAFMKYGCFGVMVESSLTEEEKKILGRFAIEFERTYTRFLDLQKAEAQAREGQIQLALERVRARTMAMQHSRELPEAANLLFQQAQELGMPAWSAGYCNWTDNKKAITFWMSSEGVLQPPFTMPTTEDPSIIHMREAAERDETFYVEEVGGETLVRHYEYMRTLPVVGEVLDSIINAGHPLPTFQIFHLAYFAQGFLLFITYEPVPEAHDIFKRFGKVFEQTYTRFLDLQKAEAQVREAEIQLALERVRARTMAMQHSNELAETAYVLYQQFTALGEKPIQITIGIISPEDKTIEFWGTDLSGNKTEITAKGSVDEPFLLSKLFAAWEKKQRSAMFALSGKELEGWVKYRQQITGLVSPADQMQGTRYVYLGYFSKGAISISTDEPLPEETIQILERFAAVFDGTYTRFLDLQRAEKQARQAQIEVAMEKVRSRSLAMQKPEELTEVARLLRQEMASLGVEELETSSIYIHDQATGKTECWYAIKDEHKLVADHMDMNLKDTWVGRQMLKFYHSGKDQTSIAMKGEKRKEWINYCSTKSKLLEGYYGDTIPDRTYHLNKFSDGYLGAASPGDISAESWELLKRATSVFSFAYTRFSDLQQAEAQAREAQIQLALERVRARTMAMQKSGELAETVSVLFKQLLGLGIPTEQIRTCGIVTFDAKEPVGEQWITEMNGDIIPRSFMVPYNEAPAYKTIYQWWKKGKEYEVNHLEGKALQEHLGYLAKYTKVPLSVLTEQSHDIYNHALFFSQGYLFIITRSAMNEYHDVFKRFGSVFQQSYTRFLDLQKAEAQAREGQIELALERVRARTMAMQYSSELKDAASILFEQVEHLGINTWTSGFQLWDNDRKAVTVWTCTAGVVQQAFRLPVMEDDFFMTHVIQAGQNGEALYVEQLSGKALETHYKYMASLPGLADNFKSLSDAGIALPLSQVNHAAFFTYGYLLFITYEPIPEAHDIFKRFAKTFEQTYTRFLDLQKAEAQAREAQIELSLERVRAKTMAMHTSEHVGETVATMFDELVKLGIEKTVRCGILIIDETKHMEVWTAAYSTEGEVNMLIGRIDMMIHPLISNIHEAWKNKEQVKTYELVGKDLKAYYKAVSDSPEYPVKFDIASLPAKQTNNAFFFPEGAIFAFTLEPLSADEVKLFKRFAGVFGLTYRRFLDLQKAEMQAKESQIQLSLERVRARTMAMQKSDELAETATVLFQQLLNLGISSERTFIGMPNDDTRKIELWGTEQGGYQMSMRFEYEANATYAFREIYRAWQEKRSELTVILKGKNLEEHVNYVRNVLHMPLLVGLVQKQRILYNAFFSKGLLMIVTPDAQSKETLEILERFAGVFDGTYTRFLDLQRAEEQARESKIQLALERVRARTMAMQKSDELREVIQVVYDQLVQLGTQVDQAGFGMDYRESNDWNLWIVDRGHEFPDLICIPYFDTSQFNLFIEARDKGLDHFSNGLGFEEKNKFFEECFKHGPVSDEVKEFIYSRPAWFTTTVLLKNVTLFISNFEGAPYSEAEIAAFMRFGKVFEQTYRRYLDLQKAEEQAREATIEAALEKVRGKALAMYNSADLTSTASMVFTELRKLGINPIRCGVGIFNKGSRKVALYSATTSADGDSLGLLGWVMLESHPVSDKMYESLLNNEDYFPVLKGKQLKAYYENLLSGLSLPTLPDFHPGEIQYGHFLAIQDGNLYAWAEKPYNETEIRILKRFAAVIDLTFRRYVELQKSEASTRDAVRAASLDRVRAEIASMRSTGDLERITPLIWNELTTLGIPFIRCGVFIVDEQAKLIYTHLSTADGKALTTFNLPFDSEGIGRDVLIAWRNKQVAAIHWSAEEFDYNTKTLVNQGTVTPTDRYVTEHPDTSLDLHFLPFLQGMLYVGNVTLLTPDEIELVQSLADAFSTAYARYEDFNKLEASKQQVENTLTDLKATQTKLIQSEKMASLGELTAGIAHEIQNPLNFVNNFSEVNQEMIDELEEELRSGNIEEALTIAADIKQNEEKINHHGKRADGIVKGMLQHSRTGGGEKQPTNMNVLADEFLRLSYHGLRAKDKTFNAEMITHFDPDLPKISVIPQDMGRVLLNLFNNAFYAVNQKMKASIPGYKPEVIVTTELAPPLTSGGGGLLIKVRDNGIGMPEHIKEKIMQPFFTTKPTGEGTGLGLSLTYDMVVKGHGGKIDVDTKEGEYTEFTVSLPL